MKKIIPLILATPAAFAFEGFYAQYDDWDIACDNTGTCRAAGYHSDETPLDAEGYPEPVSLLFTRDAGAEAGVTAQLQIIPVDNNGQYVDTRATLTLNGETLGEFTFPADNAVQTLDDKQTAALLAALPVEKAEIVVTAGERKMPLSALGAAAALLKMDDFQGRLDTPSALVKKGNDTKAVPEAVAKPQIKIVIPPQDAPRELAADSPEALALMQLFDKDFNGEQFACVARDEGNAFTLYPLGQGRVLSETNCWTAAYNGTMHYAIVSDDLKTVIAKIRGSWAGEEDFGLNDYAPADGKLTGYFKGRGLGDCWSTETWAYDGERFVQTSDAEHGQCKGFPGGAWEMPTLVTETVKP
ncbi:MAG: DUF1176 domain-containing protein [Cardiobacteriaceae bacterium]|nr:DUF1176 domain-containing protein [Cardiobacteriaceae bacterium]